MSSQACVSAAATPLILQPPPKRRSTDAQSSRRLRQVAVAGFEHLLYVLLFFFLGDAFQIGDCRCCRVRSLGQGLTVQQLGDHQGEAQVIDRCALQQILGRKGGAFDDVFQFADVAGPVIRHEVGQQCVQQSRLQWRRRIVAVQAMHNVASNEGDVFTALP